MGSMSAGLAMLLLHGGLVLDVQAMEEMIRLDAGLTFGRFEQQVKSEIGGARGERLVEDTHLGLTLFASYAVWGPIRVGLFTQLDVGSREAARFDGLDADGAATTTGRVGGSYVEWWIGPLVRGQWRGLFGEVGWGAIGLRHDGARDDLPAADGSTDGLLQTTPAVAWLFAIGGVVPVVEEIDVVLRMEFRVRYYDSRGGEDLAGDLVHGTQELVPFVGIAYTFERTVSTESEVRTPTDHTPSARR